MQVKDSKSFAIRHYGYQIENEIFWTGLTQGWEKESIKIWIKLCESANTIVDVGANTGLYSLIAKTINPQASIYAFEPVARVYAKLLENLKLNNFNNIVTVQKALSDYDGSAVIYDAMEEHVYSVTVNKNLSNSPSTPQTKIETIKLDTFIDQHNIQAIDLIKIDVETHEPEVLKGYINHIKEHRPTILIEILNDDVGASVFDIVKELNYLYFNIDELGSIRQVKTITKSDYYNYLLCNEETARKINLI